MRLFRRLICLVTNHQWEARTTVLGSHSSQQFTGFACARCGAVSLVSKDAH